MFTTISFKVGKMADDEVNFNAICKKIKEWETEKFKEWGTEMLIPNISILFDKKFNAWHVTINKDLDRNHIDELIKCGETECLGITYSPERYLKDIIKDNNTLIEETIKKIKEIKVL